MNILPESPAGYLQRHPTDPFTTLELQNLLHDVTELCKIRRSPNLEALKLLKRPVGAVEERKYSARDESYIPQRILRDTSRTMHTTLTCFQNMGIIIFRCSWIIGSQN